MQSVVLVFLLSMAFISCKKISVNEDLNSISQEQKSIQLWLNAQKVNNTSGGIKRIEALSNNLLFGELWVEKNDELKFIVVPIKESYKFSNNKENKVSNYFVSVLGANSILLYSVIIQNKPINIQNGTSIKHGAIANIYDNKPLEEDCNVRFITIYDYYLHEKNYKNKTLISTLNLYKKPQIKNDPSKQDNTSSLTGCTDWYWVTTHSDGTQTWSYVTTTCPGGCGVSNPNDATLCPADDGGSGGGGGGDSAPIDPQENVNALANICESSFLFNTFVEPLNGIGGWQVAGTTNIHMQIVDLTTGQYRLLALPTIYFAMPVYRAGDYYSPETAASNAAEAVEYAETEVMSYYHSIGGALDIVGMTLYYRQKMNSYMQAHYSGAAMLLPGSNISISSFGSASYGWPIIGCL